MNLITAPIGAAGFAECYVGDYMTSMVKPLFDFEYILCYYFTGNWQLDGTMRKRNTLTNDADGTLTDGTYCTRMNYQIALPLLTGLPLVWRFLQCIKRFYQSKQTMHIFNAGKYATVSTHPDSVGSECG